MANGELKPLKGVPAAFANVQEKINEIIESLTPLLKLQGAGGIKITPSQSNVIFSWVGGETGGDGEPVDNRPKYPLDLTLIDSGGSFTGTFRPGYVNGLIPSNYLSLGGISKTGTVYIELNVTLSNAEVQTASFSASGSPPPAFPTNMSTPPTSLAILTHVVVDGIVFRVLGPGNPWLTVSAIFETDKTGSISPGEKSTNVWYSYSLTTVA